MASLLCSRGLISILAVIICVILFSRAYFHLRETEVKTAANVAEARAVVLTRLRENGIPAFEGNYYLQLTTFTDNLHPNDPTFQSFEIMGVQSTAEAETYYLVDSDGYISTLTFAHNGLPAWYPDNKTDSAELDINPPYKLAARHFLEGDFSIRFVPGNLANSDDS